MSIEAIGKSGEFKVSAGLLLLGLGSVIMASPDVGLSLLGMGQMVIGACYVGVGLHRLRVKSS